MLGLKLNHVSKRGHWGPFHCDVFRLVFIMRSLYCHDDVIKWKHFPRYWPFVRGIHRSPVNSPHKDQWRGALMFTLICARINAWVNNREDGDLRRYRRHYDVIVMVKNGPRPPCDLMRLNSVLSELSWYITGADMIIWSQDVRASIIQGIKGHNCFIPGFDEIYGSVSTAIPSQIKNSAAYYCVVIININHWPLDGNDKTL